MHITAQWYAPVMQPSPWQQDLDASWQWDKKRPKFPPKFAPRNKIKPLIPLHNDQYPQHKPTAFTLSKRKDCTSCVAIVLTDGMCLVLGIFAVKSYLWATLPRLEPPAAFHHNMINVWIQRQISLKHLLSYFKQYISYLCATLLQADCAVH